MSEVPQSSPERGAVVSNGPESASVVAALRSLADGDAGAAGAHLDGAARSATWATVLHRMDVAGRAIARDDERRWLPDEVIGRAADGGAGRDEATVVLAAWLAGDGVPATVDLESDLVDTSPTRDWALVALHVLGALVHASGFPPEVVV